MTNSPDHFPNNPTNFRAPPPSPIASGRRSSVINEDAISEFLQHSIRIPDLILPDRIFPVEIPVENPPEINFGLLGELENDSVTKLVECVSGVGCFLLVDHGISGDLIRSVTDLAAGIFGLANEKKALVSRSGERMYGFEEGCGGEEEEEEELMGASEAFVWGRNDDRFKLDMEGIWSGYSNFGEKMKYLSVAIENVACKVLQMLFQQAHISTTNFADASANGQEIDASICCLYKHCQYSPMSQWDRSLKSEIIRMLIRGSEVSHALCVHICDGTSEFHVYSKKGWISFNPNKDAIVVTVGDQVQAWSGGQYRSVMGRPVFKVNDEESISMAFLYSPPVTPQSLSEDGEKGASLLHTKACHEKKKKTVHASENKEKTISIKNQIILSLLLTLIYHFSVCIYKK